VSVEIISAYMLVYLEIISAYMLVYLEIISAYMLVYLCRNVYKPMYPSKYVNPPPPPHPFPPIAELSTSYNLSEIRSLLGRGSHGARNNTWFLTIPGHPSLPVISFTTKQIRHLPSVAAL
jgi:hypothetical protein